MGADSVLGQSIARSTIARAARGAASIVLLKNDGVLPLSRKIKTLAVIGPTADEIMSLLGNYYGTPAAPVTILQGIRDAVGPQTQVLYSRGADLVEGREEPRAAPLIEAQYLRPAGGLDAARLKGEYFRGRDLAGAPALTRVDSRVAFRWDRGAPTDDLVARGELRTRRRSAATTSASAGLASCCRRCRATTGSWSAPTTAFGLYLDGAAARWLGAERSASQHERQRGSGSRLAPTT